MNKIILSIAVVLSSTALVLAQEEPLDDPYALSLEELMNIPISVSKSDLSLRETPSVTSVITRDEIRNMGARDLMDILNQVPGFTFGVDVQNVVGLGSRGNWGHEGKILLLIDGQEMNEILFSTTQFGQHYDITNIDRIEIIRGPGSSIYGGYAELGVINIITRKGGQLRGASLETLYGTTANATTRTSAALAIGDKTEAVEYSVNAYIGQGIRSDQTYTDIYGTTGDLTNNSTLRPFMINGGLSIGDFSARVIVDRFESETIDQFDAISATKDRIDFHQVFAEAKYDWKASDKLTITPKVNFKTGNPWTSGVNAEVPYNMEARRLAPSVNVGWAASKKTNIVAGVDSYFDHATHTGGIADYFGTLSDKNEISFFNVGLFAQAIIKTDVVNITLGSRYDNHNQFGDAFSPRIGFTKSYEKFHFKALYSRAFRAPALENLNYNPDVEPERTGVAELELGYKLSPTMFLTGNLFHIQISDPIVYFVDASNPIGTYANFSQAGSVGLEVDYRIKSDWGYVSLNYAYYSSNGINEVPYYSVPTDESRVLAMPGHRVNANASIKLGHGLSLNPSVNVLGNRYAVTGLTPADEYVIGELESELFVNLYLRYVRNNLELGFGVYDIADEGQKFVQPFASGHAVFPAIGREFSIRAAYTLPFN
jgi:outer membrane cobalamin receptor